MIERAAVEQLRASLPELPAEQRERFESQYGLHPFESGQLTEEPGPSRWFEAAVASLGDAPAAGLPRMIATWIVGELNRLMHEAKPSDTLETIRGAAGAAGGPGAAGRRGKISNTQAKEVFEQMYASGEDADVIVERLGVSQISGEDALSPIIRQVLEGACAGGGGLSGREDGGAEVSGRPGDASESGQGESRPGVGAVGGGVGGITRNGAMTMARRIPDAHTNGTPNFRNRTLYRGDNLSFLRGLNTGTIHLIATDPPFKKGRDFHATPSSVDRSARFEDRWRWDKDVHPTGLTRSRTTGRPYGRSFRRPAKRSATTWPPYLAYMAVRFMEMHRVLRNDGLLYLHCDFTAGHYLKMLLDAIFGHKNFRNEIVWCKMGGGQPKSDFPRKHDTIFRYSKSGVYTFNDEVVRVAYDSDYAATVFAGEDTRAPGKTYHPDPRGKIVEDWWDGIRRPYGKAHYGYPTQKPVELYERIIASSTNVGDFVLDPFCGCATTIAAAERLDRQWIGADIWEGAYNLVVQRLVDEGLKHPDSDEIKILERGEVVPTTDPPRRDDDDEVAAPVLKLKLQRPKERWQTLSRVEIVNHLAPAQTVADLIVCAGCGRALEREFMELDHIQPRADGGANDISNRILLCRPCNGNKRQDLTLTGLLRANKRSGWMRNEEAAKSARLRAIRRSDEVRDNI